MITCTHDRSGITKIIATVVRFKLMRSKSNRLAIHRLKVSVSLLSYDGAIYKSH